LRRCSRSRGRDGDDIPDGGSSSLEFITVGILLLVPLVYLVIALGEIQGQAMGAESGARHIARAIALAPDATGARERADAVLRSVVDEYGIDSETVDVTIECVPAAGECPQPGATLTVTISTRVTLPLAPDMFSLDDVLSIPIEASASQKVSRLWGTS